MTSAESFLELESSTGAAMAGGTTYGWLGPRVSFGRDGDKPPRIATAVPAGDGEDDGEGEEDIVLDFEFRLNVADPVAMLPADELFSGGKLLPLQLKPSPAAEAAGTAGSSAAAAPAMEEGVSSRSSTPSLEMDQYVFSPKMPARCSSRWRELLGLKRPPRQNQQEDGTGRSIIPTTPPPPPRAAVLPSSSPSPREATGGSRYGSNPTVVRGLKHYFLHRNAKPSPSSSASPTGSSIPLLRDSSTSSSGSDSSCRLSLSSSSSSLDHELDLPRLSLDSLHHHHRHRPSSTSRKDRFLKLPAAGSSGDVHPPAVRVGRSHARRATTIPPTPRGSSVDSPRMNSYGKIVFQSLGRSSSSPSALSGPKKATVHHRAIGGSLQMERSYSANVVRVTPVLNVVPVCSSLRVASSSSRSSPSTSVLAAFFSPHKKDKDSSLARGCKTATTITDAGGRGRDCAAPLVINN